MKEQLSLFNEDAIVYVGTLEFSFRGMLMSHMASPSVNALHKMAESIGIKRKWFHDKQGYPHYDICKSKKKLAIQSGAIEINDRALIRYCYKKF